MVAKKQTVKKPTFSRAPRMVSFKATSRSIDARKAVLEKNESMQIQKWMGKSAGPLAKAATVDTQAGSGIPNYQRVKQVYWERITVGDGVAAPYPYSFRLNSTFDPNETGTGHQPKGRDFMAGIYNDYTVVSARYNVHCLNAGTSNKLVGALVSTDAPGNFSIGSIQQAMEAKSRYNKKALLQSVTVQDENTWKTLAGTVQMEDFAFDTSGSLSEQFSTGVGSNPSTPVRLHLYAFNEDGTAVPSNSIIFRVEITYDVVYHGVISSTSS